MLEFLVENRILLLFIVGQVGFLMFEYVNVFTSQLKAYFTIKGTSKEAACYTTLSAVVSCLSIKLISDMPYLSVVIVATIANLTATYTAKEMLAKKRKKDKVVDVMKIGGVAKDLESADLILDELRDTDLEFTVLLVEKKKGMTKRFEVYAESKNESRLATKIFIDNGARYDMVKLVQQSFV